MPTCNIAEDICTSGGARLIRKAGLLTFQRPRIFTQELVSGKVRSQRRLVLFASEKDFVAVGSDIKS
jgi:hypothetical protein